PASSRPRRPPRSGVSPWPRSAPGGFPPGSRGGCRCPARPLSPAWGRAGHGRAGMPGSGPGTSGHTSRVRSRRSKPGNEPGHSRPTRADLAAAYGTTIPDLAGPDLRVLLVGINPSLYSGWTGHHFARPGNRLWRTLHEAGFTQRRLDPQETDEITAAGLGITNLVARATARADELSADEVRAGVEPLCRL